ncbi:MAG: MFS transporter, partial [Acidobacteria bacterium]|nr:MFS transporter [Acidobacteriota bacterium]
PRRPWATVCAFFTLTGAQSVLLAAHAPVIAIAAAAFVAGFGFSFGSVIYETGVQQAIAPEKLSRVSAYSWMCAMAFLPAGYALAGVIADAVGTAPYLVFGAGWILATTVLVLAVPSVRNFRLRAGADVSAAPAVTT